MCFFCEHFSHRKHYVFRCCQNRETIISNFALQIKLTRLALCNCLCAAKLWLTVQDDFDFGRGRAGQVGVDCLTGESFAKVAPSKVLVHHSVDDDVGVDHLKKTNTCKATVFTKWFNKDLCCVEPMPDQVVGFFFCRIRQLQVHQRIVYVSLTLPQKGSIS